MCFVRKWQSSPTTVYTRLLTAFMDIDVKRPSNRTAKFNEKRHDAKRFFHVPADADKMTNASKKKQSQFSLGLIRMGGIKKKVCDLMAAVAVLENEMAFP